MDTLSKALWAFVTIVLSLVLLAKYLPAATINVNDNGYDSNYTVNISGNILRTDGNYLAHVLKDYPKDAHYNIYLDSPGGAGNGMIHMYNIIKDLNATTIIREDAICYSACAALWVASSDRILLGDAKAGFHVGSIGNYKFIADHKESDGWLGVQELVQNIFARSIKFYILLEDINDNLGLVNGIVSEGYDRNNFFFIDKDNIQIVGGKTIG